MKPSLVVFLLSALAASGSSCLLTNEFGVAPVNAVSAREIPEAVARQAAGGWRGALGFFEHDKRRKLVSDSFKENLLGAAYSAGAFSMASRLDEDDYFTRESFENCREQAFNGAFGTSLIQYYGIQFGFATSAEGTTSEADFFLTALLAGQAGAGECRTALIKTGRVFEAGFLRF